ncbi:phosphoribosyltransferase family protein [Emticicia fontis]
MTHTFSLHKVTSELDFGFSADDYSRFKFGDSYIAGKFGRDLANGLIDQIFQYNSPDKQMVVISSPYAFIPTATFAMKNQFVFTLNRWLAENNKKIVQEAKVQRTITYKEDYGELNAQQRFDLIKNDRFHIDKDFLRGKVLLFLDDIRITGSHEMMITRMLKEYELINEVHLLYFAELVNKDIHPNIENYLNYYAVKSIFDLNEIIKGDSFAINTRIVKYILNSEPMAFNLFIQDQTESFINLLYDMAIGNEYHTIEAYQQNLNYLKTLLHKYHKIS